MTGVHQLLPRLEPRDATGNHTLLLREAFREQGWSSEIFVHEVLPGTRRETRPLDDLGTAVSPSDILVYQFATASPIVDVLLERAETLVVHHHNVTPPELYQAWDPSIAASLTLALQQLRRLARRAVLGVAVSEFNRRDLASAGFRKTSVVPVVFDHARGDELQPSVRSPVGRSPVGSQWLFVGRLVPSKAQHRLVAALWTYRRLYDPTARLVLVGAGGHPSYSTALERYIRALRVEESVAVVEGADDAQLRSLYRESDIFVSLSEHEGFGIPLVEAMAAGLPVVALAAGAVPETMGPGGLLLERDDPLVVAAAVRRVLTDGPLRAASTAAGRRQAEGYSLTTTCRAHVDAIAAVVGSQGRGAA